MPARYRDFDAEYQAAKASQPDQPPITFKLGGQRYSCIPEAPGGLLLDIVTATAGANTNDPAAMSAAAAAAQAFFLEVLIPEDRARMITALRDTTPGKVIPIMPLVNVMQWVVGEYMGKDGRLPSGSPPSPSPMPAGLTAASP